MSSLLILPLALLLFLQWPLRELVQAFSRQANDLGQILFAFYIAVAILAASRAGAHVTASVSQRRQEGWTLLRPILLGLCLLPWTLYMLWVSIPYIQRSVLQMEKFGDTGTPGFFLVKLALGLMLVLILVEVFSALRQARRGPRQ